MSSEIEDDEPESPSWLREILAKYTTDSFEVVFIHERPELCRESAAITYELWTSICQELGVFSVDEFVKEWLDIQTYSKEIPKSLLLVCRKTGRLAGFIYVEEDDIEILNHLTPWITVLYIAEEYR